MAEDCERLSRNARKIFKKLKVYYPPDSWKNQRWNKVGTVFDNGWHDLRKTEDRMKLIERARSSLGFIAELNAEGHRRAHGSLAGFTERHFTQSMQYTAEKLLILKDLDFQIETLDLCGD